MKLLILWSVVAVLPLCAQIVPLADDNVSEGEWKQQQSHSIALALKLYPELSQANDRLKAYVDKIWPDANHFPSLAGDSFAPLFYANVAAQDLGVIAQWQNLTDAERADVFQEISYHSKIVYRTACVVDRQLVSASQPSPYVSPATTDFIDNSPPKPQGYTIVGGGAPLFVIPNN